MTDADKAAEDQALKIIQQHIVDSQDEQDPSQPPQEVTDQQVAIIIAHTDSSSSITKEESLSPKPSECQSVGVQTQTDPPPQYNVLPDDGCMGYDDGVRVLRAIGSWAPEYSGTAQYIDSSSQGFTAGERNSAGSSILNGKTIASSTTPGTSLTVATKTSSGEKSFLCPVCHKGLARKDKLVIHMRIHTGEKPYVCEVCDKAFARRDKLVMHMNKLKHLTPSNIAPLGKRHSGQGSSVVSLTPIKQPAEIKTEKSPAAQSESLANELRALGQPRHVVAWSCEICGRLCSTRDEWAAHAKSHLNDDVYNVTDRHVCMLCRQEFSDKADLAFHMRQHLSGKGEQLSGLADLNSICS